MKFKEMTQMNKEEREKKLRELELELIKLNAQVATGTPPKNAGQLKRLKKDISKFMLLKGLDEKKAFTKKETQSKQKSTPNKKTEEKTK